MPGLDPAYGFLLRVAFRHKPFWRNMGVDFTPHPSGVKGRVSAGVFMRKCL